MAMARVTRPGPLGAWAVPALPHLARVDFGQRPGATNMPRRLPRGRRDVEQVFHGIVRTAAAGSPRLRRQRRTCQPLSAARGAQRGQRTSVCLVESVKASAAAQYELNREVISRVYSDGVRGAWATIIASRPRSWVGSEVIVSWLCDQSRLQMPSAVWSVSSHHQLSTTITAELTEGVGPRGRPPMLR